MLTEMYRSVFFLVFALVIADAAIINRYDESECNLDPQIVHDIASYKNVTQIIMEEIKNKGLGERMFEQFVSFLDKFGARPSGTETLEKAIDHMINLTRAHGVTDVTTEQVDAPHWVRGHESVSMISPREKNIAVIGLGSSVSTPKEGITAEAIVVKNFKELDEKTNDDIKGKIVVYDVPYVVYWETVQYRSHGASKAAAKGAVASLIRSVTPFSIYSPHTGAQYYDDKVPKIPAAAITHEDADLLSRLQIQGEKIVLKIQMASTFDMKKSRNTIIDVKGKEDPDKLVIVSGHIDSWDVGQGAMDDGGGMIISWLAPIALHHLNLRPKRTLRAILWTAEEPGLVGAQAYINKHINELDKIDFVMESDEGTFKPRGLTVAGSKEAQCLIAEVLKLFSPIDKLKENDYLANTSLKNEGQLRAVFS
ncbi:carboxypeptidase Q-like [Leguminivora glycinivorella]|uniref:carboxypeptidase Q-like n=1 Tax=Leguminivora glycinivorella TaxID=1035111 RepID=UPI00200E21C3|nr:carboxypeptidase Q-like [Leguminivora glycinivorella]